MFEVVSRLYIISEKSKVYPANEGAETLISASILRCEVGTLPTKYLGFALRSKTKAMKIWNDILVTVIKKLPDGRHSLCNLEANPL